MVFGGTAQFLEDTRRGLFSYEALRSRLADSRFTEGGYTTMNSPVIRLRRLSDNELLALVRRLAGLHAELYGGSALPDSDCEEFLRTALARAGAEELMTPREIIRDFLSLLDILREHPEADLHTLLAGSAGTAAPAPEEPAGNTGFLFDLSL